MLGLGNHANNVYQLVGTGYLFSLVLNEEFKTPKECYDRAVTLLVDNVAEDLQHTSRGIVSEFRLSIRRSEFEQVLNHLNDLNKFHGAK